MASYKYKQNVSQTDSAEFDREFKPGEVPHNSGIYRCKNCGDEIAANKGNPLPPQNNHQHPNNSPIIWQLSVYAVQKK